MKLTAKQVQEAKAQGCLKNRETEDEFSVRIITENGVLNHQQLQSVSEAAARFGNGNITFTSRMTLELPGVAYENIPALQAHLKQSGLSTGGTGAKIRPIVACKGTTCVFGQIDTQAIAKQIHDRFFVGYGDVTLPHKFKIAVGGCPNNCVRPDLNDFGLIGQRVPAVSAQLCRGCKICQVEQTCLMGAPKVTEGKVAIDKEKCNACGKCIPACPFGCLGNQAHGVKVVIGGKWGRVGRVADRLEGIYSISDALDLLEAALLVFRKYGYLRERFGDLVNRLGAERVAAMLESREILKEKEAILAAPNQKRPVS